MSVIQPPQSHAADVFSELPTSPSAENNKAPILEKWLAFGYETASVLEIGSGTGQHGVHLAQHCPKLRWQPTEVASNFAPLQQWWQAAQEVGIINLQAPIEFEIGDQALPKCDFDTIYTSNVLHIVDKQKAEKLVEHICEALGSGQKWVCYGPFKRDQQFTTESNKQFNDWLLAEGHGGLLDLDEVLAFGNNQLEIEHLEEMPANNFFIVFNRR